MRNPPRKRRHNCLKMNNLSAQTTSLAPQPLGSGRNPLSGQHPLCHRPHPLALQTGLATHLFRRILRLPGRFGRWGLETPPCNLVPQHLELLNRFLRVLEVQ